LKGDLGGSSSNPTVPGLANKESLANKSTSVTLDALSDVKYPSAKAVKSYVDLATQGVTFSADLNLKAEKNSPTLTGIPNAPTATSGTNTTQIATTAYVKNAIDAAVNDADDEFTASTGQTIFTLTQLPFANSNVRMYINGIKISLTAFRMSGRQVEYLPVNNGGTQLINGSRIQLEYYY
jgi:hypothetical protein